MSNTYDNDYIPPEGKGDKPLLRASERAEGLPTAVVTISLQFNPEQMTQKQLQACMSE